MYLHVQLKDVQGRFMEGSSLRGKLGLLRREYFREYLLKQERCHVTTRTGDYDQR